jgi:hypothetical protein
VVVIINTIMADVDVGVSAGSEGRRSEEYRRMSLTFLISNQKMTCSKFAAFGDSRSLGMATSLFFSQTPLHEGGEREADAIRPSASCSFHLKFHLKSACSVNPPRPFRGLRVVMSRCWDRGRRSAKESDSGEPCSYDDDNT